MNSDKLTFFERIALNTLLRSKKFKIENKIIYDEQKLPVGKEIGRVEARNLLNAQNLKAMQKPPEEKEISDAQKWSELKKSMARITAYDGAKLIGSDRNPLSAIISEVYLDGKKGLYWMNTYSGNYQVIGPHPWNVLVSMGEKNDNKTFHINYIRDSRGRLTFMPKEQFEPKMSPEDVLLDPETSKYDTEKIIQNLEDLEKEKKAAGDLLLLSESKLNDLEKSVSDRVISLQKELDKISSMLNIATKQKPKKVKKTEEIDGSEDTGEESDNNSI